MSEQTQFIIARDIDDDKSEHSDCIRQRNNDNNYFTNSNQQEYRIAIANKEKLHCERVNSLDNFSNNCAKRVQVATINERNCTQQLANRNLFTRLFKHKSQLKEKNQSNYICINNKTMKSNNNSKQTTGGAAGDRHRHHMIDVDEAPLRSSNNKNNNSDSGDHLANNSETNSTKGKNTTNLCCLVTKWIFILMAIGLLTTAIVFLFLSFTTVLDNEKDQCYQQTKNSPFQTTNNYQLYSTKTLYTTVYNYLSKLPSQQMINIATYYGDQQTIGQINSDNNQQQQQQQQPQSQPQLSQTITIDRSSIQIPNIFSKKESLESLNQRLQTEGCQVKQLHFFGRHAARLPNKDDLMGINKHIASVQNNIARVIAKLQEQDKQANAQTQDASSLSPTSSSLDPIARSETEQQQQQQGYNKTRVVCSNPKLAMFAEYKQWRPFATEEAQGNLVTELGALESQGIAQRFKRMFPEMFNGKATNIDVGVTDEIRTSQTALEFVKTFESFSKLDSICNLDQFPQTNTRDVSAAAKIANDRCYDRFRDKFSKPDLRFYHECDSKATDTMPNNYGLNLRSANRTQFIADAISKKLGIDTLDLFNAQESARSAAAAASSSSSQTTTKLTSNEAKAVYDACRYESAINGNQSLWCNLFEENELRFYEYLNDIDDYFNNAYGSSYLAQSACGILKNFLRNKLVRAALAFRSNSSIAQEANFYFTHSEALQRIIAASFDLSKDRGYAKEIVLQHLDRGTVPKGRQWQTSLFTPFSANLAFILYQCPNSDVSVEPNNGLKFGNEEERAMYVAKKSPLKLVASLNEQPVILGNCNDYACDLDKLVDDGRIFAGRHECDLESICRQKITYS